MLKTIVLLILVLIVLPIVAINFDSPPTDLQYYLIQKSSWILIGTIVLCFTVSELTQNCSQVDKLWSLIPLVYAWTFAYLSGWDARTVLMAVLVTIWGLRLTYNFSRRGGYSWKFWGGEEDYRWNVLRANPVLKGRVRWTLFNLFFISAYQLTLIWLFTLPLVASTTANQVPLTWIDFVLAGIILALIAIETIADQQQWNYQNEKYALKALNVNLEGEYADGFVKRGLWAKVRHPNYAAEQSIWVVMYAFSIVASGRWVNWSMAGCILLLLLFQGSADFSEKISAEKYPKYNDYIKNVPRFLPKLF